MDKNLNHNHINNFDQDKININSKQLFTNTNNSKDLVTNRSSKSDKSSKSSKSQMSNESPINKHLTDN